MSDLHDELKDIRTDLRLAMNGVISSSMREKGVNYRLNFGVAYPEIKLIAAKHKASTQLAEALWKEDIREFKILASFLQPAYELSIDRALGWVADIPYMEIAEHCSRNLFSHLPYSGRFIESLFEADRKEQFSRTVGFLTATEICKRNEFLSDETLDLLLKQSVNSLLLGDDTPMSERFAALQALKFYGRQTKENGERVLRVVSQSRELAAHLEVVDEIYNELKFEFDYYL